MPAPRPSAALEPSGTLRIARACPVPWCGAVFYVASVSDDAECPACATSQHSFELSA